MTANASQADTVGSHAGTLLDCAPGGLGRRPIDFASDRTAFRRDHRVVGKSCWGKSGSMDAGAILAPG